MYINLEAKDKSKLSRIVNMAGKIIRKPQKQLCKMYLSTSRKKAWKIVEDPTHLNSTCSFLESVTGHHKKYLFLIIHLYLMEFFKLPLELLIDLKEFNEAVL